MVAEKNFEWYMGEDLTFDVYYAIDGVAQDMTNYVVRMDIAAMDVTGKAGAPLVSLNSDDFDGPTDKPGAEDNEIVLDTNGKIHVVVSREVTLSELRANEAQNVYAYDLFLRDKATNKQRPLLRGTILLTRAVTQWA